MSGLPAVPTAPSGITEDALLGGRVTLRQPASGYRAAIDPVLLAASVPARAGDSVLDIGCGVGAASLCLAARVADCRIAGIEAQGDLFDLAVENIALNRLGDRVKAVAGNLLDPPAELTPGSFDQVMANPPFLRAGEASAPPDAGKAMANVEGDAGFADWVGFALAMARPGGGVSFIHRADRLEELLVHFAGKAGGIVILPLWPGAGKPAKRVIVHARKEIATPTLLLPGLTLHESDGRYSDAAEAILRHGAALTLG
jgi:tRNA1(Val) A37 N6-methylase TrmN6